MNFFALLLLGLLAAAGAARAQPNKNIVDLAAATPELSILARAVKAAGLADELSSAPAVTVFAPTNAAFEAALSALGVTAEELLADVDTLRRVLLYHVVPGALRAADLKETILLNTLLEGATIGVSAGPTLIDAAGQRVQITTADIEATNGVVHLIGSVLLPPAGRLLAPAPEMEVVTERGAAAPAVELALP